MQRLLLSALASLPLLAVPAVAQQEVPTFQEANAALQTGRFEEAASLFQQRAKADPDDGQAFFLYAYSLHAAGDLDAAHDAHIDAARFPEFTTLALYNHACVHALRSERDGAFHALDEAIAAGFNNANQLEQDPDFAALRNDGRFASALLRLRGADLTDLGSLPAARRFDFYLGDWSTWDGDAVERQLSVQSSFDGNGLSVSANDPKTGEAIARSLFVYDAKDGVWREVWTSRDGVVITLEGGLKDGSLILNQTTRDGRPTSGSRSVFSDITAYGFTYRWQESSDGGKTWTTVATRLFTRS